MTCKYHGCSSLEKIIIPEGVEIIGMEAFSGCKNAEFSFPLSLKYIESSAFRGCQKIKKIHIPKNVSKFDNNPFIGCVNLEYITVDENNNYYDSRDNCNAIIKGEQLISGCKNTVIPKTISAIGSEAFAELYLSSLDIPNNITYIGYRAFYKCLGLKKIVIPNSVEVIYREALQSEDLEEIILGSSLKTIYNLNGMENLKEMTCYAELPPKIEETYFGITPVENVTLYVPEKSVEAYRMAKGWDQFGSILPIPGD